MPVMKCTFSLLLCHLCSNLIALFKTVCQGEKCLSSVINIKIVNLTCSNCTRFPLEHFDRALMTVANRKAVGKVIIVNKGYPRL